jgi:hypothetical protein
MKEKVKHKGKGREGTPAADDCGNVKKVVRKTQAKRRHKRKRRKTNRLWF